MVSTRQVMNHTLKTYKYPSGKQLQLVQGDITSEQVDAIINAANAQLRHGAGVAGAILERGGAVIQEESDRWVREHGSVAHDTPACTSAGNLPCRYVIHAVGPVWGEGDEDTKLQEAVQGSMHLADQLGLSSIALPALSTGIFGFPKERAAALILSTIRDYLASNTSSDLKLVRIVLFDQDTVKIFVDAWECDDHIRT